MKKNFKKLFLILFFLFFFSIACLFIYLFIDARSTFSINDRSWDGVTSANCFSSGDGTLDSPYEITNAYELYFLSKMVNSNLDDSINGGKYSNKYYILTDDIDLNNNLWLPIGNSDFPFVGSFDGNGHTIYNLKLSNNYENVGLFGVVYNAVINRVSINNINIELTSDVNVITYIGSLFGKGNYDISKDNSTFSIDNVNFNLGEYNINTALYLSDFIGYSDGTTSFSNIIVYHNANDDLSNDNIFYQGLYGDLNNTVISNAFANGFHFLNENSNLDNAYYAVDTVLYYGNAIFDGTLEDLISNLNLNNQSSYLFKNVDNHVIFEYVSDSINNSSLGFIKNISKGEFFTEFETSATTILKNETISFSYVFFSSHNNFLITDNIKRFLVSDTALPDGTLVKMVDLSNSEKIYYFQIDNSVSSIINNKYYYDLSKFHVIGSASLLYDDSSLNITDDNYINEKYIFVFDFSKTNLDENYYNSINLIITDESNNILIDSVDDSNSDFSILNSISANIVDKFYSDNDIMYFNQDKSFYFSFLDYNSSNKSWVKVYLYDSNDNIVDYSEIENSYVEFNNIKHFITDGSYFKIRLDELITTIKNIDTGVDEESKLQNLIINLNGKILSGSYYFKFEFYDSPDGLFDIKINNMYVYNFTLINNDDNYISVDYNNDDSIFNKKTGLTYGKNDFINYKINYVSIFDDVELEFKVYKKTGTTFDFDYIECNIDDIFKFDELFNNPDMLLYYKDSAATGTYKFSFFLKREDVVLDSVDTYFIIK